MLCKVLFLFNSGSHFVQLIRTDLEILLDDLIKKPSCDLF